MGDYLPRTGDGDCFSWTVMPAFHPVDRLHHRDRQSLYPDNYQELNFDRIELPVEITDLPEFQELNDISINV